MDSDSSAEEIEDGDDFEDASESFHMEDDVFIDNVIPKKPQYLSMLKCWCYKIDLIVFDSIINNLKNM